MFAIAVCQISAEIRGAVYEDSQEGFGADSYAGRISNVINFNGPLSEHRADCLFILVAALCSNTPWPQRNPSSLMGDILRVVLNGESRGTFDVSLEGLADGGRVLSIWICNFQLSVSGGGARV